MEKPIFIVQGFLDSGKTTFIKETLEDPEFREEGKILIILCEEGEEEYDEVAYAKRGIQVITVEDEAQLTSEFLFGLETFYEPDMIMVEMNGMWKLENFLDLDFPEGWVMAQIITMVDSTTFPVYMANMRSLMLDEVRYADVVIVNRCDDNTDKVAIRRGIKPVNRKAQIIYEREDGMDAGEVEEELPYDMTKDELEITDDDYGIWYMDAMDHPENYAGKTVRFLGMLYVSPKLPTGYIVPGRMAMTCCADDIAFIGLLTKVPPTMDIRSLRSRQWFEVTATMKVEYQREYKGKGPVLYATKMIPAQEPADKLVYFN